MMRKKVFKPSMLRPAEPCDAALEQTTADNPDL